MTFDDDLDFAMSELGVLVQVGREFSFQALFDYQQVEFANGEEPTTIVNQPTLTCQESDISGVQRNRQIKVEGRGVYIIDSIEPDGAGTARLYLRRQQ